MSGLSVLGELLRTARGPENGLYAAVKTDLRLGGGPRAQGLDDADDDFGEDADYGEGDADGLRRGRRRP
ncbi:hypothetical protein [Streptomyces sp. NPDC005017]|uniref:hypothetical protein n=1 Tax=Streptomyces sp. NPDC005017 TaxID=3364706 RepID=UPI0036AB0CBE